LRETGDIVEKEGIRRAIKEIEQADLLLLVYDLNVKIMGFSLIRIILYITVFITALSGISYFVKAKEVFLNPK